MNTRNSIFLIVLSSCTAALPFAIFGIDPVLLIVLPGALIAAWFTWQLLAHIAAHEAELNERLARHYARRAIKLHLHAQRQRQRTTSEVQP